MPHRESNVRQEPEQRFGFNREIASIEPLLRQADLFKGLDPLAIRRLASEAVVQDAAPRTPILRRGQSCAGLYVVLRGRVKLALVAANGREKVVAVIDPGRTFAEETLLFGDAAILDAQCLQYSKLLLVARGAVFAESATNSRFLHNLLHHLTVRLRDLLLDVESYSLFSGTQRVIGYLLRGFPACAKREPQRVVLDTNKKLIASRLNVTCEHFSRILHDLAAANLIEMHGREIVIPDVATLRAHLSLREQRR